MSILTQEQTIALQGSGRFQQICQQQVKEYATYLRTQDGTVGNLAGFTPVEWAKRRVMAAGISQHPNSQDWQEWVAQMSMRLKGANVWDTNVDITIDGMVTLSKFEEIAIEVYALRSQRIEF